MDKIKAVLAHYFECDFQRRSNRYYDSLFSAQEAIDAIIEIVKEADNG